MLEVIEMTQSNRMLRSTAIGFFAAGGVFLACPAAATLTITGVTCASATSSVDASGNVTVACSTAATPAAKVPGAPTIGTATAGNASASVAFAAPASNGGAAIDVYRATCNPGAKTGTGSSSPLAVTGLSNGTAYTCTVAAHNSVGWSTESSSASVTPTASAPPPSSCSGASTAWTQFSTPGSSTSGSLAASATVQNKASYSFTMNQATFPYGVKMLFNVFGTLNNVRDQFISDCPADFTHAPTATGATNDPYYCSAMGYTTSYVLLAYPSSTAAYKSGACVLDPDRTYYLNIRTDWSASQGTYLGTGYLLDTQKR
jgi:hypothetical protein